MHDLKMQDLKMTDKVAKNIRVWTMTDKLFNRTRGLENDHTTWQKIMCITLCTA